MYLVESVIGVDKDSTEEKESVFVILKHPYLIEKDPVTGQVSMVSFEYQPMMNLEIAMNYKLQGPCLFLTIFSLKDIT